MRFRVSSGQSLGYVPAGSGPITLVMLHPVGLRAQMWERLAAELEDEHRSLAIDLPGHGESDVCAKALSIADMATLVRELIDALAGPRVVLIGCSMGSAVAASVAGTRPPSVEALVLSNTSFGQSPERMAALAQRAKQARSGMAAILDETVERWFPSDVLINRSDIVATVRGWLLAGDPIVHSNSWLALREFDYAPLLPALTLPTLVIGGERDDAAKPPAVKALAVALAGAEYRQLAGASHLSPFDQPHLFADAVRDFLGRRLPAGGD